MTALDHSPAMVEIGADRDLGPWILSDASALPLRTHSLDAVAGVNAPHHLSASRRPLSPISDGSRASAPCCKPWSARIWIRFWYRHYFPEIDDALLPLHPTLGGLITAMFQAGFHTSQWPRSSIQDAAILPLKRRAHGLVCCSIPISAHRLQDFDGWRAAAIARGLAALERDLDSGAFARIAATFDACPCRRRRLRLDNRALTRAHGGNYVFGEALDFVREERPRQGEDEVRHTHFDVAIDRLPYILPASRSSPAGGPAPSEAPDIASGARQAHHFFALGRCPVTQTHHERLFNLIGVTADGIAMTLDHL